VSNLLISCPIFSNDIWKTIYKCINDREFIFLKQGLQHTPAGLMPWEILNKAIIEQRLLSPRLKLFQNGEVIPESDYTESITENRDSRKKIQIEKFYKLLRDEGASLVINSVDDLHKPLTEFICWLEESLKVPIQVNLYASFRNIKGFKSHWDTHDVLVLQLYGNKNWTIFGETNKYPLYPPKESDVPPSKPIWNGMLNEGDILYIPRGYWHHAEGDNNSSLHLTIGIHRKTGVDYFDWIKNQLLTEELFRKDIPLKNKTNDLHHHSEKLRQILLQVLDEKGLEKFLDAEESKNQRRQPLGLPFAVQEEIFKESFDKYVLRVPKFILKNILIENNSLYLKYSNKTWEFSKKCLPFFEKLRDNLEEDLTTLIETFENSGHNSILKFIKDLIYHGIITVHYKNINSEIK